MAGRMKAKLVPPSQNSPDRRRMPRGIWDGVDRVVATGLALDPDDRFASPRAWLDALDAVYAEMQYRGLRQEQRPRGPLTRVIDWLALRVAGKQRRNVPPS